MLSLADQFKTQFPDAVFLDAAHPNRVGLLLRALGILEAGETVLHIEKPGEGNMNFVRRVVTNQRSFILKQSRPWVEKYPQVAAPVERLEAEAAFYHFVERVPELRAKSPTLVVFDPKNLIMITEDLGAGSDYTSVYRPDHNISSQDATALVDYLVRLHGASLHQDHDSFPTNQTLKQLNHAHIFDLPFRRDNGFDLDTVQPGLQQLAQPIQADKALRQRATALGEIYLDAGSVLIHGDFYPGSWLSTAHGLKVIDPEFAYVGYAEFDLGVMLAHLLMAGQPFAGVDSLLDHYRKQREVESSLAWEFAGIEIIRRLLGLAQLPLRLTLAEKQQLIGLARSLVTPTVSA